MILRKLIWTSSVFSVLALLPIAKLEETRPAFDTNDWIPITPNNDPKPPTRESKSSDRILNIENSGEKFFSDGKYSLRKPSFVEHRPRKPPHMKRSPNLRPRPKLEQPYRFETILAPPPKHHQIKNFPQKQYQQGFNVQPQYQFNLGNQGQVLAPQGYQPFPSRYNLNSPPQTGQNIPQYSTVPLGLQYQHPSFVPQISPTNNTIFQTPGPGVINSELFETLQKQNIKLSAPTPSDGKETVQLLYVPLDQLQKQQNPNDGLLDEAFKSLQQQKLVAQPQETISQQQKPQALPLVSQNKQQVFLDKPQYSNQDLPPQIKNQEPPKYFELISKNRGELILPNSPKSVQISGKQHFQVQSEQQKIVEVTSAKPSLDSQVQHSYIVQQERQKVQEPQVQQSFIQQTRNQFIPREPQAYLVQQQSKYPSVQSPQLQQSYIVQSKPNEQNYFVGNSPQKSRLENIQRDILQQTLEVENLQKQIQQGKSIAFQAKSTTEAPKKRKPHQPPLAVYMEGNNPGDVEAVLEILKDAKSIAVQDQIGPNSPQVFIGPSNLNTPEGFTKFPLPYLSSLDNNRIQRKAQQFPFFVAPLNYREPDGYSKIPLPSPHVGSVVVSLRQNQNNLDHSHSSHGPVPIGPVPINNYKFVHPDFEPTLENHSNFDNNLNAYSLESPVPRENPNKQLKEQTLYQQIRGFSGLEFPQNPYFPEVNSEPELNIPVPEVQPKTAKPIQSRQKNRGETLRGTKKENSNLKNAESAQVTENDKPSRNQVETRFQEVTPENFPNTDPRESPNRYLQEQSLFQQITGFSGFDYPQNQYFQEVNPQPQLNTPDQPSQDVQTEPPQILPSRPRDKGESLRGTKKGTNLKDSKSQNTEVKTVQPETRFQETSAERGEISSQNPLTQEYFNRFGSNNNHNYNFVSSTPEYGISSQTNIEEIPANIRKLNVRPGDTLADQRNQQSQNIGEFEKAIKDLENSQLRPVPSQGLIKESQPIVRDFEQYRLPIEFTNINPQLPGLINKLEDQDQPPATTFRQETNPIISTRLPVTTTQVTIQSTEAITSTTTRKPRSRGRSRFNTKTTTSAPYRRPLSERRRPSRPTTESSSEESYRSIRYKTVESERVRPRVRLQDTLSERISVASVESTSPSQPNQLGPKVIDISQRQPNYFMEFQSMVENERPILGHSSEEQQTEAAVKVVEQYQSQKVTPADQIAVQREEQTPVRQFSVTQADRSEARRTTVTQRPADDDKPTRKRVRVRGRPKNKYSSTTIAPRTTSLVPRTEQTEFYGFIRQPNFPQSSQVNSQNEEERNIHIYAPIQQRTSPVYVQRNYESVATTIPSIDAETTVRFVGELRPKYSFPSRGTTTETPEVLTTQRSRTRGRVRVPGRPYEIRANSQENSTTERSTRGRIRGRTHFTSPRSTRQDEADATDNYPASFLRSRETSATPSNTGFKITVDPGEDSNDQIPYSTINRAEKLNGGITPPLTQITTPSNEDEKNYIERDEEQQQLKDVKGKIKQEGYKVVNVDQFDTAESQDYRGIFNSIEGVMKINELKEQKSEERGQVMTVTPMTSVEKEDSEVETKPPESAEVMSMVDVLKSSIEDLIAAEVSRNSSETDTSSPLITSTTTADVSIEVSSTIPPESMEGGEITSTISAEDELKISTSTEAPKSSVQTALDLLALQTSTSTEISHETEICYKGRCLKSRNRKFRRPVS